MDTIIGINPTQVDATAKWKLGTVGRVGAADNAVYKYVQYSFGASGTAAPAIVGTACFYQGSAGYQNSLVTSDVSVASTGMCAGIMMSSDPTDDTFCWIQIKGYANCAAGVTGAAVAGDPLTISATDGVFAVAAAVTDHIGAWLQSAAEDEIMCDFPY